jgi:hypothetical protein
LESSETWHVANEDAPTGGRKREEAIRELGNMAHHRGLTRWRARRGRSALVSSETWHAANEDSPARLTC